MRRPALALVVATVIVGGAGTASAHTERTSTSPADGARLRAAPAAITVRYSEPVAEVESRDEVSGATLSWKRTRTATSATRGVRMFFLELASERPLSVRTIPAAITSMDHIVVSTSDPERAAALYGARLGLDMALDRSHPDWGRLMFFRCGDLIVEVTHRPGKHSDAERDSLWGITWRVDNMDATRERLVAVGVDVSEVRNGRKPGTRGMTGKSGTCGIPTLLLERSPKPA